MKRINIPYFGKLLRDAFRVTEQTELSLIEEVVPTYNLSPNDVYFKYGAGSTGLTTVPVPTEPITYTAKVNHNGLLDSQDAIFSNLQAGCKIRISSRMSIFCGGVGGDEWSCYLQEAVSTNKMYFWAHLSEGDFGKWVVDSGWIELKENCTLYVKYKGNAAMRGVCVVQIYLLPSA
jgi:hypothetical protein